jgi:hypothetical protein
VHLLRAVPPFVLACACGRTELIGGADADADGTSVDPSTSVTDTSGPPPPPPPSCREQGGTIARNGGPWVITDSPSSSSPLGVVVDETGLFAMWLGPFVGTPPSPNVRGVRVDRNGVVQGEPFVPWERLISLHGTTHAAPGGALLTYCGRDGTGDLAMSRIVDASGQTIVDEVVRTQLGQSCGAVAPDGVWTGSHHLFAWTDNSGFEFEVTLDVADASLNSQHATLLAFDGELTVPPRFAVGAQTVTMIVGLAGDAFAIWRLDLAGEPLMEPAELFSSADLRDPVIAAAPDGSAWIWLSDGDAEGIVRIVVDPTGAVTEAFVPVEVPPARYSELRLEPWPGGAIVVGNAYAPPDEIIAWFAVDDRGSPIASELVDDGLPSLYEARGVPATDGDQAWVLYRAGFEDDSSELRLFHLGCVD